MASIFKSQSGTSTSTQTSAPWQPQQKYLKRTMSEADRLYQTHNPTYYPGSTVAGFNKDQTRGFDMVRDYGKYGNSSVNAAQKYNNNVLGGKYLNSNPYQDEVFNNVKTNVMPSVNSNFMNAGRYGSGMHGDMLARAMTESYAPIAAQMYEQGLSRMDNAARFAPQLANEQVRRFDAMSQMGGQRQDLAQRETDDAQARHNYYQDLPFNKLAQYRGMIDGNFGGQTTSAVPYNKPSTFSRILGGLSAGLGLLG
jgi:hypothetical protein